MYDIVKNTEKSFYNLMNDVIDYMRSTLSESMNPSQIESVISEATSRTTNLIRESINTIDKNLKSLIQNLIKNNSMLDKTELLDLLLKETSNKFSQVYNISRADLIAQTTSTFTTCLTQKIVCKELKYDYVWLTQRDAVVRSSHRNMDNMSPDKTGMFHLAGGSGEHPGAISSAAESCHCRCYLFAVKK